MDQETLVRLIAALEGRQWMLALPLALVAVIALGKYIAPAVWHWIPRRLQWVPAVLGAAAAALVDALASGMAWPEAVGLVVSAVVMAAPASIGFWHALKRIFAGGQKQVELSGDASDSRVDVTGGVSVPYDPTAKHAASEPPKDGAA